MTPQRGNKGSRRYRYYVSKHDAAQAESCSRIPASDLEAMVQQGLTKLLGDPLRLSAELGEGLIANEALAPSCSQLAALADDRASLGTLLGDLGARIIVRQERIHIFLDPARTRRSAEHRVGNDGGRKGRFW